MGSPGERRMAMSDLQRGIAATVPIALEPTTNLRSAQANVNAWFRGVSCPAAPGGAFPTLNGEDWVVSCRSGF